MKSYRSADGISVTVDDGDTLSQAEQDAVFAFIRKVVGNPVDGFGPVCDAGPCMRPKGHLRGHMEDGASDDLGTRAWAAGCACGEKPTTVVITDVVRAMCEKCRRTALDPKI